MATNLARLDEARERTLASATHRLTYIDEFKTLDVYRGTAEIEPARPDWIATISAGMKVKNQKGQLIPSRTKDGKIVLHDPSKRAPGLLAALSANNHQSLLISFPFDDPAQFIQQRFTAYSASKLLAHGDEHEITELTDSGQWRTWAAGSARYREIVATCKVSVSVFFALAEWTKNGPQVVFPDGLGFYRLRFTSRHSLRSIVGTLKYLAPFTGGRFAGVPFELSIDYREVAKSDGTRITIPCWSIALKPPTKIALSSGTVSAVLGQGIEEGKKLVALALPAPQETLATAISEEPDTDLDEGVIDGAEYREITDEDVAGLVEGGRCDKVAYCKLWHPIVRGTPWEADESRAKLMRYFTAKFGYSETDSLKAFLDQATDKQAAQLIAFTQRTVDSWRTKQASVTAEPAPTPVEPDLTDDEADGDWDGYADGELDPDEGDDPEYLAALEDWQTALDACKDLGVAVTKPQVWAGVEDIKRHTEQAWLAYQRKVGT